MPGCRDVAWYEGQQGLHELQSGGGSRKARTNPKDKMAQVR